MLPKRSRIFCPAILAASLALAACETGSRPQGGTDVPPADIQQNVNISNPITAVYDLIEVTPGGTFNLVWSDEFDGDQLDPETWFFATGDGSEFIGDGGVVGLPPGWGNFEKQWYLPRNAQLENGFLRITARAESVEGFNYTSARITTRDRVNIRYGRIAAKIKFPAGQGLWSAFWMLSQGSPYGQWAATGEIDIVEAVNLGAQPGPGGGGFNNIVGNLYYGGAFPDIAFSGDSYRPSPNITEGFHTYAVEWDENEIRWYFDDVLWLTQNSWSSTGGDFPAPFDQPFYIILNTAVGGSFPGDEVDNAALPASMLVDWVRVYSGVRPD